MEYGLSRTHTERQSKTSGQLKLSYNDTTQEVSCTFDGKSGWKVHTSALGQGSYYAMITAYTKTRHDRDETYLEVNVDNFAITKD